MFQAYDVPYEAISLKRKLPTGNLISPPVVHLLFIQVNISTLSSIFVDKPSSSKKLKKEEKGKKLFHEPSRIAVVETSSVVEPLDIPATKALLPQ